MRGPGDSSESARLCADFWWTHCYRDICFQKCRRWRSAQTISQADGKNATILFRAGFAFPLAWLLLICLFTNKAHRARADGGPWSTRREKILRQLSLSAIGLTVWMLVVAAWLYMFHNRMQEEWPTAYELLSVRGDSQTYQRFCVKTNPNANASLMS